MTQVDSGRSRTSSVSAASNTPSSDTEKELGDKDKVHLVVRWTKDNLEHWQENGTWFERLSHTYYRLRLYYRAIKAFEAGKLVSEDYHQLYWVGARAYAQQGNTEKAIEEQLTFLRLVKDMSDIKPADKLAYLLNVRLLVIWYIDCKQFEKAIEEASAALDTAPFAYNLHFLVLEAARQSDNQPQIKDSFAKTLAEPGEDGHSSKLTGLVEFAVDMLQEEESVWSIEKVVASARNAGTVSAVLESLQFLSTSGKQGWFVTTCKLFESFVLAFEPDSLQRSIEMAEYIVEEEQNLAEFKKGDSTMELIFREAHPHLADMYFSRLVTMKVDDDRKEEILAKMQDMISLSQAKMAEHHPYGQSHLAAYHVRSGDKKKAQSLLRPFLEEALDLLVDESLENDPDAFIGLALCLGYFQDEYNSLNAWSLLAPYEGEGDNSSDVAEATAQPNSNMNELESYRRETKGDDVPIASTEAESERTDTAIRSGPEANRIAGLDTREENSNGGPEVSLTDRAEGESESKEAQASVTIENPLQSDEERNKNISPRSETLSSKEIEFRHESAKTLEKRTLVEHDLHEESEIKDAEAEASQKRATLENELWKLNKLKLDQEKLRREQYRRKILLKEKEREERKEAESEKRLRKRALEDGKHLN